MCNSPRHYIRKMVAKDLSPLFFVVLVIFEFLTVKSFSQESYPPNDSSKISTEKGSVTYQLTEEQEAYFALMDSLDAARFKPVGFRIQVFSASGPDAKNNALETESEFLKIYEDYPSYTKWNYPNWVVRLGDYRTQLEAMEFHEEIKEMFPASFIVKDEIQLYVDK